MDFNIMLYVTLLLILVGLFVFSLLRRRVEEEGGQNEPSGPITGATAREPEERGEGE